MKAIKLLLVLALTSLTTVAYAADVSGHYYCKGYDPYVNRNYEAKVDIKKIGKSYAVVWDLGKGEMYTGSGMINEDGTTFSVMFYNGSSVKNSGLAVYRLKPDAMNGQWVMSESADKIGFENCTRQR